VNVPDPNQLPLASVVMPAFNHEAYVEDAIRSVLAQSYPRVELVVVDDGSTDRTAEIADRLAREHGFVFVRNEQNIGLNPTLMKGFTIARGEYVSMLASDDMIMPHKIAREVDFILSNGLDGTYANGVKLWDDGRTEPIDLDHIERRFKEGTLLDYVYCDDTSAPLFQSGLFSKRAILELFPYRARFKSDDWILLIKFLEEYKIGFLNEPLFYYRQHENNSFRRYWTMLPIRLDVVAHATPERLRGRALANLFLSQAQNLYVAGERGMALKFLLASLAFAPAKAPHTLAVAARPFVRKLFGRRAPVSADPQGGGRR
jgi:alpha-1,3-rhamnosyltransferase